MEAVSSQSISEQAQNYWKAKNSKNTLVRALKRALSDAGVKKNDSILVICGGNIDIVLLETVGFTNYALSTMTSSARARTDWKDKEVLLNAESLQLEDNSFDVGFAHDVLHHC